MFDRPLPARPTACRCASRLLASLLLASSAAADELVIPLEFDLPNFAGLGVGAYPRYLGSNETAVGVAPLVQLGLGGERFVRLLVNDLRGNLLDTPNWRLGPVAQLRFGRGRVDDPVIRRLRSIDSAINLGRFGGYRWRAPIDPRQQAGISG
ncbi:MAG: hypothetical protein EA400_11335 [Chromatiaceae bacterium]|nr:MAG: hypothetical protein EA400_11335 [Chromatiaceae bacterium]